MKVEQRIHFKKIEIETAFIKFLNITFSPSHVRVGDFQSWVHKCNELVKIDSR